MYAIQIYKSVFAIKNCLNATNSLYAGTHEIFPMYWNLWRKIFKRILTHLYLSKCNDINVYHLGVQKK